MSDPASRIALAHEAPFALGPLLVRPPTREVVREDGAVEVLEPRVMQVLVALHRSNGAILSRDDLTLSCWEGRVVGEDAINRVISRLRKTIDGAADGAFRIETVTKVGYRLVSAQGAAPALSVAQPTSRPSRRRLILAGASAAALIATGGAWWTTRRLPAATYTPPAEVAEIMAQVDLALAQDTREGQNQAIGLLQQVVAIAPDYADGWGALAEAYAIAGHYRATPESEALRQRARAAAARSLSLDPDNALAQIGKIQAQPWLGNWLAKEQALRAALRTRHGAVPEWLAVTLASVGRLREGCDMMESDAKTHVSPTPNLVYKRITLLWAAGRQDEADRLMTEGGRLFPTHFAVWFARCYALLYSGRPDAALAMVTDRANRPSGIADNEIERLGRVIGAALSRKPAAIDAVMREQMAQARLGNGLAENAMQFASLLDRLDDAFAIAAAYYFDRGWTMPEVRFHPEQGTYLPRGDRMTTLLFTPSSTQMRADPRFGALVVELGLEDYWRRAGVQPDYRRFA